MKKTKSSFWVYLSSLIVPMLIILFYFLFAHMPPFGHQTFLQYDISVQYLDFFRYYKTALFHDPSSILYSFNSGFGNGMIGTWAYYLMSPLNLLFLFANDHNMLLIFNLVLMIKIMLSGGAFIYWIRRQFPKVSPCFQLIFSLAYALNGWTVTYYINLLWLDAMIVLPFFIWGLYKLLHFNKWRIYVIALTLMVVINYYMALMFLIFSIFLLVEFLLNEKFDFDKLTNIIFNWVMANLISGLISAFLWVPTLYSLLIGKLAYKMSTFNWHLEYNPFKLPSQFVTGAFVSADLAHSLPHVFLGSVSLILAMTYFFNQNINVRKRWISFGLTVFFCISSFWRPLDLLWHGLQMPTWYEYRWSYLFVFWLLMLASATLNAGLKLNQKQWYLLIGILIAMFVDILFLLPSLRSITFDKVLISIVLVVLVLGLLMFQRISLQYRNIGLLILTIFELSLNLSLVWNVLPKYNNDLYVNESQSMRRMSDLVKPRSNDFYRINKLFNRSLNDGLVNGISTGVGFNSSLSANNTQIGHGFGQVYTYGLVHYSGGTLVGDSLLGFRYVVSNSKLPVDDDWDFGHKLNFNTRYDIFNNQFSKHDRYGNTAYENKLALPLGFAGSNQVLNLKQSNKDDFRYQNMLVNSISKHDWHLFDISHPKITETSRTLRFTLNNSNRNQLYIYIPNFAFNYTNLMVNGHEYHQLRSVQSASGMIFSLPRADKINLNLVKLHSGKKVNLKDVLVGTLNLNQYQKAFSKLKQHSFKLNHFGNTKIDGSITIGKTQNMLLTTIPYDLNWTAQINGKVIPTTQWQNFIGLKLKPGHYVIKFRYHDDFLEIGIVITVLTLLGISIFYFVRLIRFIKK